MYENHNTELTIAGTVDPLWAQAIATHVQLHSTLAPVIAHEAELQIRTYQAAILNAAVLLQWADTIHAEQLDVRVVDGRSRVSANGRLLGGIPVTVWTFVDGFAEHLATVPTQVELSQLREFIAQAGEC